VARSEPAVAASRAGELGTRHQATQDGPRAAAQPSATGDRLEPLLGRLDLELNQWPDATRLRPVPMPGGSTSPSPRAGVEQYSARPTTQLDQLRWEPRLERLDGLGEAAIRSSLRSANPTTTPTTAADPNGTTSTEPTPTSSIDSGSL